MIRKITYRTMKSGDESKVFDLIERTFHKFVAPDFTPEGITSFFRAVTLESIEKCPQGDHVITIATLHDRIVGMMDIRNNNHISLFFVDKMYQRQGIGSDLLDSGITHCLAIDPSLDLIEVHSAPSSVPIYGKLGFTAEGKEQDSGGIRYTRMIKKLKTRDG